MKILVLGSNGQLGKCLQDRYLGSSKNIIFLSKNSLDITNFSKLREVFLNEMPNYIINASAYTLVDESEDFFNIAQEINYEAVESISKLAHEINSVLIHVSTDYVFDGFSSEPYKETAKTNPLTKYGLSKLNGERSILNSGCNSIIIRTAWVFSEHGNNFLKTMISLGKSKNELKIVNDQIGAPTYAQDLASTIVEIIDFIDKTKGFKNWGIYNFCGDTICSWFDFASLIFKEAKNQNIKTPKELWAVNSSNFITKAQRPKYSVLTNNKINNIFGIKPSNLELGVALSINKIKSCE